MSLHLVQILPRSAALIDFAHRAGLPDADPGYLWHRALRDAFGEAAPQPFRVLDAADRPTRLLGYSAATADGLREALALAPPDLDRVFPPASIDAKPLPLPFASGRRLAFEARLCPIVRTAASEGGRKRELDAFIHHAESIRDDPKPEREPVYRHWLADRLEAAGARLEQARMTSFRLVPLVRRRHPRPDSGEEEGRPTRLLAQGKRAAARRPEVVFEGTLEITDGESFARGLARGIGRHRAFGFGMLLLRRA